MNSLSANWRVRELLSAERPLVIGHRGYSAVAPENTLPSFQQALVAGADLVELDYRHSRDGVPVVFHDRTLDRKTDARRRWRRARVAVQDRLLAELQTLDAGAWFDRRFAGTRIPLLAEALEMIRGAGGVPVIEHKSGDAAACVGLLRDLNLINRVIVISFDWLYLRVFHRIEPAQVLGALGPATRLPDGRRPSGVSRRLGRAWLNKLPPTGASIVVWTRQVSAKAVQLAHYRELKVWVYTINRPKLVRRLCARRVDGIITNNVVPVRRTILEQTLAGRERAENEPGR